LKAISQRYLFDTPGTYRIRVQGHVAAHWTDSLAGMVIRSRQARGKAPVSVLTGSVIDQSCLMGVLTSLYEMGYTLLEVKRLPKEAGTETAAEAE
jgi:hypothetical protein